MVSKYLDNKFRYDTIRAPETPSWVPNGYVIDNINQERQRIEQEDKRIPLYRDNGFAHPPRYQQIEEKAPSNRGGVIIDRDGLEHNL